MRLVAPFGFYGWGNIGDESTLQGFARLLATSSPASSAWVGARDVAHCGRAEPSFRYFSAEAKKSLRRRWAWERAHAVVVPGGTPIMDSLGGWPLSELIPHVERAARDGKPVAFIGTGTEPLRRDESRARVRDALAPRVAAWTVRAETDRERLIEYGVSPDAITTAADLAWTLNAASPEFGRHLLEQLGVDVSRPLIAVNVNAERHVQEAQPMLLPHLASALDHAVDRYDARVVFLCNEVRGGDEFDLATARSLHERMRAPDRATIVPNEYFFPQQMMSIIAACQFTLSTRYHFCLFSAVQGVPFLAVERSSKLTDLRADLGWAHGTLLSDLSGERLRASLDVMHDSRPALAEHLAAGVARMRARSATNSRALDALANLARR